MHKIYMLITLFVLLICNNSLAGIRAITGEGSGQVSYGESYEKEKVAPTNAVLTIEVCIKKGFKYSLESCPTPAILAGKEHKCNRFGLYNYCYCEKEMYPFTKHSCSGQLFGEECYARGKTYYSGCLCKDLHLENNEICTRRCTGTNATGNLIEEGCEEIFACPKPYISNKYQDTCVCPPEDPNFANGQYVCEEWCEGTCIKTKKCPDGYFRTADNLCSTECNTTAENCQKECKKVAFSIAEHTCSQGSNPKFDAICSYQSECDGNYVCGSEFGEENLGKCICNPRTFKYYQDTCYGNATLSGTECTDGNVKKYTNCTCAPEAKHNCKYIINAEEPNCNGHICSAEELTTQGIAFCTVINKDLSVTSYAKCDCQVGYKWDAATGSCIK